MNKETVDKALKEAEVAFVTYITLKEQYEKAFTNYQRLSRRFQTFDRELAEIDGRVVRVPACGKSQAEKSQAEPKLTLQQRRDLAALMESWECY